MKINISIFILVLSNSALLAQKQTRIEGLWGVCEEGFFACEQIEFKPDSTFEYGIFYDVGGWSNWEGTWDRKGDTIIINTFLQKEEMKEQHELLEGMSFYYKGYISNLRFLVKRRRLYKTDLKTNNISNEYYLKRTSINNKVL